MPTAPRTIRIRRPPKRDNRLSSSQRGYDWTWRKRTAAWIEQQAALGNTRCALCNCILSGKRREMHVDHRIPPSSAGPAGSEAYRRLHEDESNWQLACPRCNTKKSDRVPTD